MLGAIGISEIVSLSVGNAVAKIVCSALVLTEIATYAVIEIVRAKRRKTDAVIEIVRAKRRKTDAEE